MPENPSRDDHATDAATLLTRRTRASLWIVVGTVLFFGVADLGVAPVVRPALYGLKAAQLVLAALGAVMLRGTPSLAWARVAGFVNVTGTFIFMAAGDWLKGHLATTPLLAVTCGMTVAALLPWGARTQLATAIVLGVGNVVALAASGRPAPDLVDPIAAVTAALAVSVYVAFELDRYRRERRETERALAERARLEALRADVRLAPERDPLPATLRHCAEALVRHTGAAFARIWTLDADGATLELQASAGMYTHLDGPHARIRVGSFKIGLIAEKRRPLLTNDVAHDPRISDPAWAAAEGMVAFAGYPLLVHGRLLGVVALFARHALDVATLDALASVAESIAVHVERARTEDARTRLVDELERASRLKSEFVSTMSHELRTPLNVIMGYTEMLEDQAADDPAAALGRIRSASRELLELIEATLDLNRLESGIDATRLEAVRLDALAVELAEELGAVPRAAGVQLAWSAIPAVTLVTDRRKLRTVVKNLVGNALKFTAAGRVSVGARADAATVVLTVTDTGIGIPAEEQPHIFDKFRQVDSSDRRSYGGVGLGLHIVQRLVEQLGGTVSVASTPGHGSTFTVTLPLAGPASTRRELHGQRATGTMPGVAAEQDVAPRSGVRRSP